MPQPVSRRAGLVGRLGFWRLFEFLVDFYSKTTWSWRFHDKFNKKMNGSKRWEWIVLKVMCGSVWMIFHPQHRWTKRPAFCWSGQASHQWQNRTAGRADRLSIKAVALSLVPPCLRFCWLWFVYIEKVVTIQYFHSSPVVGSVSQCFSVSYIGKIGCSAMNPLSSIITYQPNS